MLQNTSIWYSVEGITRLGGAVSPFSYSGGGELKPQQFPTWQVPSICGGDAKRSCHTLGKLAH